MKLQGSNWLRLVFYSVFLLNIITACKTTVVVPKPEASYIEKKSYDKQVSLINIPIEIPINELESQLNKYLSGTLYEDNSFDNNGGDDLKLKVKKYAPFKLTGKENKFTMWLPLDISGGYTKLGARVNFEGVLKVKYVTEITLLDDWKLETVTKSDGYEWIKSPKVDLGWVDVPVKWLVDLILKRQDKKINTSIDEAVQEYVNLKELLRPAFDAMAEPIHVSEDYDTWFSIEPIEAFITPLVVKDGIINITVGMKAFTESFIGKPPRVDSVKVIPIKISDELPGGFTMDLVTILPFREASNVLEKEFVASGYEYVEGKYHLTFTRMGIFGQDGQLVIQVGMQGSVKGEIYLKGDPYYDLETRTIRMKNVDFDFKSKQVLLKSADWLVHGKLCKVMEKNMYFDIGGELDASKIEVQEYLNAYQPVPGVEINGRLDHLETSNVYLIDGALIVVLNAGGELNVKVRGLD